MECYVYYNNVFISILSPEYKNGIQYIYRGRRSFSRVSAMLYSLDFVVILNVCLQTVLKNMT